MIRALVFDLDDTLYLESDFVSSGYRAVAGQVGKRFGFPRRDVFYSMMCTYASYGKDTVLGMVQERYTDGAMPMSELVAIYRQHRPSIHLLPGYADLLKRLRQSYRLGIITDGLPEVQRRKTDALGLANAVECIIYTWEYGREKEKPHPLPFLLMLESLHTSASDAVFVGDNPAKDLIGARGVGMKCASVRRTPVSEGTVEGEDQAEFVIDSLHQLPVLLDRYKV